MLIRSAVNFRISNSSELLFSVKSVVILNHELCVELVNNITYRWKEYLSKVEVI